MQSQFAKKVKFSKNFKNHHELIFFNRNMQREKKIIKRIPKIAICKIKNISWSFPQF
jgi:hypothetical protein